MNRARSQGLAERRADLARILRRSVIATPALYAVSEIRCETLPVLARDGIRLATDVYRCPGGSAPTLVVRTPYGRGADGLAGALLSLARRGYVVIAQDCRGTGASEPESWDYYLNEPEDSYDLIEWVTRQPWFDGFVGALGGSYLAQMQWQMALHPKMSTIVPDVSGLGVAINTAHLHMFLNAYARSVGKGEDKTAVPYYELEARMLDETWASGYFNAPLHPEPPPVLLEQYPQLRGMSSREARQWLWAHYCALPCAGRARFVKWALEIDSVTTLDIERLPEIFGQEIAHDRHTLPHVRPAELATGLHGSVLLRSGWYDWGLNDTLATWALLQESAPETTRSRCRLFIGPNAHNMPGYHEGFAQHPELHHAYGVTTTLEVLLRWYAAVREDAVDSWPTVIYYLMGANEWCVATQWPPEDAKPLQLYLEAPRLLTSAPPAGASPPDVYTYDPQNPTPTVGGSIVSYVYPPGSVDVSEVQLRPDVLTYTTAPLDRDLDVVGPLQLILYVSSSAVDTDFVGRLSDVFPDGRAIQLQNGMLRVRYRDPKNPQLIERGKVYRLEIDLWGTANRFKAGHRLRLDISSSDFPRYDRNANRGGEPGAPLPAVQTIYHDADHPSHLLISVL